MKKIGLCLLLLVMLVVGSASAEKIKYKDPAFTFKSYKTVAVTDILPVEYKALPDEEFISDPTVDSKITTLLRSALIKKGIGLETPDQEKSGSVPSSAVQTTPAFSVKVYRAGYNRYYNEAWLENREVIKEFRFVDRHGDENFAQIPINETVAHPAGYSYVARIDLEFNVINPQTGKIAYTVRDSRERGGETDIDGMLTRACNDFVGDLT